MTQTEIDAFLAICRENSISKAAAALFISQSSLSTRLKTLEREIGCPLFIRGRGGRQMELTAEGWRFYELALQYQKVLSQMHSINASSGRDTLRVSAINSLATFLLPPVSDRYLAEHPDMFLEIQETFAESARRDLTAGETDLALIVENRDSFELISMPLFSEQMAFICSGESEYPEEIDPIRLPVEKEIYVTWSNSFIQWHNSVLRPGGAPRLKIEIMSQLELYIARAGSWAILPVSVARGLRQQNPSLQTGKLSSPVPGRIVYGLYKNTAGDLPIIRRFLDCIHEELLSDPVDGMELLF